MATNRAYKRKNRVNNQGSSMDSGAVVSSQNNAYSGAQKNVKVGPAFLKQDAEAFVRARDVSGANESVQPGSILHLYNNSTSVAWVALSTEAIGSAPTGFTNGIPLQPASWTVLSADENKFIRTSAATVGLYEMKDDTNLKDAQ